MKEEYAKKLISKTREDYNLISDEFSRTREFIWEEVLPLFSCIKKKEKVLDAGCGNGRYYAPLSKKEVEYIGIDNSENLIKLAKNKYPGINFKIGDILDLPFPENSFDKIISIAVLHHIPSKKLKIQFLKELKRVLKNDGVIILTVWKLYRSEDFFLLLKHTFLKIFGISNLDFKDILKPWGNKTKRYYHWFSSKELKKLLKEASFNIEEEGVIRNKKGNRRNIYLIARPN